MPRVSQEHLDARRRQILDAARRRFLANGFHATSMQDILTEANLSAGAVYRYFRSKEEIVGAIVADNLAELLGAFEDARGDDDLPTLRGFLGSAVATLQRLDQQQQLAKLAVQVWGEALRSLAIGRRVRDVHTELRRLLAPLVEAEQQRGSLSRDVPADDVAGLLASLLEGFVFQRAFLEDVDAERFGAALDAVLVDLPTARGT